MHIDLIYHMVTHHRVIWRSCTYTPPILWSWTIQCPICDMGLLLVFVMVKMTVIYTPPWIQASPQTVWSPCGLCTKFALNKDWTSLSIVEPIATGRCTLYHCTIGAMCGLLACAICVTCGLIGKCIYFYSIWDIWYMSWTCFSMGIQWWCPFCDQTNHIW